MNIKTASNLTNIPIPSFDSLFFDRFLNFIPYSNLSASFFLLFYFFLLTRFLPLIVLKQLLFHEWKQRSTIWSSNRFCWWLYGYINWHFLFILLSLAQVGKSSIINRIVSDHFDEKVEHVLKDIYISPDLTINNVSYTLLDTSGIRSILFRPFTLFYNQTNCLHSLFSILYRWCERQTRSLWQSQNCTSSSQLFNFPRLMLLCSFLQIRKSIPSITCKQNGYL